MLESSIVKASKESDHMAHCHVLACIWICIYVDYEVLKNAAYATRRNNLSGKKQDCLYNAR